MASIWDRVETALTSAAKSGVDSILTPPSTPSAPSAPSTSAPSMASSGIGFNMATLSRYALPIGAAAVVGVLLLRKR